MVQKTCFPVSPVQPDLARCPGYAEQLVTWNPCLRKSQALCYQFKTDEGGHVSVLPDACANILLRCDSGNPSVIVSGFQTKEHEVELEPNTSYFGFKPFSVCGMKGLGFGWGELVDGAVAGEDDRSMREFLRLASVLGEVDGFEQRCGLMTEFAHRRLVDSEYTTGIVEYLELKMCQARGTMGLTDLVASTGYTEQYCRRRFKSALGFNMKLYSNIMRFQNVVRNMGDGDADMFDIVLRSGYYDQSHMNREFKRFGDMTPERFRRRYVPAV